MKVGLVGYQGSGKSALFEWLTGCKPDVSGSRSAHGATTAIPEPRLEQLRQLYQPKKVTPASLEIVDTQGLARTHQGNAARLATIREAGCLVLVIGAFEVENPADDWQSFEEDLLLADMEVVSGRIERIQASLKKPIPHQEREQLVRELKVLEELLEAMDQGRPIRESGMSEEQLKFTRAFRLLTEKPRMIVFNTRESSEVPPEWVAGLPPGIPAVAIPVALELELEGMKPEERAEFEGLLSENRVTRDQLLRLIMDAAGQMLFFTVNAREVRSWLLRKGGTALEAAGLIHSDMARGFIRAEVMRVQDLVRLGGEREVRAQHLVRQESKDYVIHDDDVLLIRFSS